MLLQQAEQVYSVSSGEEGFILSEVVSADAVGATDEIVDVDELLSLLLI
jgi:hypothetical protein